MPDENMNLNGLSKDDKERVAAGVIGELSAFEKVQLVGKLVGELHASDLFGSFQWSAFLPQGVTLTTEAENKKRTDDALERQRLQMMAKGKGVHNKSKGNKGPGPYGPAKGQKGRIS